MLTKRILIRVHRSARRSIAPKRATKRPATYSRMSTSNLSSTWITEAFRASSSSLSDQGKMLLRQRQKWSGRHGFGVPNVCTWVEARVHLGEHTQGQRMGFP
ncbi:hypothetical protein LY78DRAFT_73769 [Colletotrichum sublineola]|nr:hypothetical protein LY78DRAFT_73769 [Colletotrichum sublineola]